VICDGSISANSTRNFELIPVFFVQTIVKPKFLVAACLFVSASISFANAETVSVADIKALTKAGLSEEVILSQIQTAHATFNLSTAEIIELKDAGVSQRIIDVIINAPSTATLPAQASNSVPLLQSTSSSPAPMPPPGQVITVVQTPLVSAPPQIQEVPVGTSAPGIIHEAIPPSPDSCFIWVSGSWTWRHTRLGYGFWEWRPGHWKRPPYQGTLWIGGWGFHGWH